MKTMKLSTTIECHDVSQPGSVQASELQLLPSGLLHHARQWENHVHGCHVSSWGYKGYIAATPVGARLPITIQVHPSTLGLSPPQYQCWELAMCRSQGGA